METKGKEKGKRSVRGRRALEERDEDMMAEGGDM